MLILCNKGVYIIVDISLEELICYSKKEHSPSFTIIDELTEDELEYVKTVANRLRLNLLEIKDTKMVAIVNHKKIALKLAKVLKKRCQYLFYELLKRPSTNLVIYALTEYTNGWITIRDNGYVVESYNADGEKIDKWIDTNINDVNTTNISKLNFNNYNISLQIKGVGSSNKSNETIIELSRYHFLNDGIFNQERQCYYPEEKESSKGIADYNRLEKLFKKWGFKTL